VTFIASDGEEDIITCKPQWEVSQLNLSTFSSEDDGAEQVEENNIQTGAERNKYTGERSQKTASSQSDMVLGDRCKLKGAASQMVMLNAFKCNLLEKTDAFHLWLNFIFHINAEIRKIKLEAVKNIFKMVVFM
jgi:hypothetical protein